MACSLCPISRDLTRSSEIIVLLYRRHIDYKKSLLTFQNNDFGNENFLYKEFFRHILRAHISFNWLGNNNTVPSAVPHVYVPFISSPSPDMVQTHNWPPSVWLATDISVGKSVAQVRYREAMSSNPVQWTFVNFPGFPSNCCVLNITGRIIFLALRMACIFLF